MIKQTIRTVADAIRFFGHLEIEVIETQGGWILHWLAPSENDYELTCDTAVELVEFAQSYQESEACPPADRGTASLEGFSADSRSPMNPQFSTDSRTRSLIGEPATMLHGRTEVENA